MIYTDDIKRKFVEILKAFDRYIQEFNYFDIVYSKKMGYAMLIQTDRKDIVTYLLDTPETMIKMLFYTVFADVIHAAASGVYGAEPISLTKVEAEESRRQISAILEGTPYDKEFYMNWFDLWLKKGSDVERRL